MLVSGHFSPWFIDCHCSKLLQVSSLQRAYRLFLVLSSTSKTRLPVITWSDLIMERTKSNSIYRYILGGGGEGVLGYDLGGYPPGLPNRSLFQKEFTFKMIPCPRNRSIFNTLFYTFSKFQYPIVLKSYLLQLIWLTYTSRYDNGASTQISNLTASISYGR